VKEASLGERLEKKMRDLEEAFRANRARLESGVKKDGEMERVSCFLVKNI
jgi:hypothetical protein